MPYEQFRIANLKLAYESCSFACARMLAYSISCDSFKAMSQLHSVYIYVYARVGTRSLTAPCTCNATLDHDRGVRTCVYVRLSVCVCVCACVRACVRVYVRA